MVRGLEWNEKGWIGMRSSLNTKVTLAGGVLAGKRAVMPEFAVTKEPGQHRQRAGRECLVDEGLLPLSKRSSSYV
jgi:hypothetical protein